MSESAAAPQATPAAPAQTFKSESAASAQDHDPSKAKSTGDVLKDNTAKPGYRKTLGDKVLENAERVLAERANKGKKTAIKNVEDTRTPDKVQPANKTSQNKSDDKIQVPKHVEDALKADSREGAPAEALSSEEIEENPDVEVQVDVENPDAEIPLSDDWKPDYKFKFKKFDANQKSGVPVEGEIPEEFRSLIKDKESESKIREMFEKSEGFDYVKQTREKLKGERDQKAQAIDTILNRIKAIDTRIGSKNLDDLDEAFQAMGLPQEKVLHWVLNKIEYSKLPPEQRQVQEARRESEKQAQQLQLQNRQLQAQAQNAIVSAKSMALNAVLDRQDVKSVITAYDNRPGRKPTDPSFKDLVINHGELTWHRSGGRVDLAPNEAVDAVLRDYGIASAYSKAPESAPVERPAPARQPVQSLPRVESRAASPTRPSKPKSLKELREYAKNYNTG